MFLPCLKQALVHNTYNRTQLYVSLVSSHCTIFSHRRAFCFSKICLSYYQRFQGVSRNLRVFGTFYRVTLLQIKGISRAPGGIPRASRGQLRWF